MSVQPGIGVLNGYDITYYSVHGLVLNRGVPEGGKQRGRIRWENLRDVRRIPLPVWIHEIYTLRGGEVQANASRLEAD